MQWFGQNKAKVGAALVALVQLLRLFPDVPHEAIEFLTAVAALLAGSGFLPSDAAVKKFGTEAK